MRSLTERMERQEGDRWCVAREPSNPETCGPVVWSWHRSWWAAYWTCRRVNRIWARHRFPPVGATHYVLSQEFLDARWKAVGWEPGDP